MLLVSAILGSSGLYSGQRAFSLDSISLCYTPGEQNRAYQGGWTSGFLMKEPCGFKGLQGQGDDNL